MGIKPNKTLRFALRRGFSGLIYALDTESPRTGIGGQEFQGKPRGPETPERERFWWTGLRNRARKHGRLARSDEHSAGIAVFGSESGHALQVRRGTEDSCFQTGQPLALQEIEAGPVDGREVEPDGIGKEA